jgi:hypothetical protein
LFKEIIAAYSENHVKPINTKCSITDCQSRWFIQLPLGLKGLIIATTTTIIHFFIMIMINEDADGDGVDNRR